MSGLLLFIESLVSLIEVRSAMLKHTCDASVCILNWQSLEVLFNAFEQGLLNDRLTSMHEVGPSFFSKFYPIFIGHPKNWTLLKTLIY